ncbi:MAG TPA: PilZ domain-containing protein [Gammaproteobacteria bacterium]|nr:PilZ domain-containing protein [Gammaproteobacteria bacterium]
MEHRRARRVSARISALIRRRGVPVAYCATRDISLEGAQLNCGGMGFEARTPLEVDFHMEGASVSHHVRMSAVVMHADDGRVGLLFTARSQEVLARLEQLVQEAQQQEADVAYAGGDTAAEGCYSIFL